MCRLVDGPEAYRAAAVEWLASGLERGERLMYVGDRSIGELTADLAHLGDADRLVATGRLLVESAHGAYFHADGFEPASQVARYRALTAASLEDGFSGLRVAANATALVAAADARRRFIGYELAVDGLITRSPMSALCAYDVSTLGTAAAELCVVHPTDDSPEAGAPGFRLSFGRLGLELAGEVDIANQDLFAVVLDAAAACSDGSVVIDGSHLTFMDIRGLMTVAQVRQSLAVHGRDLRLVNPAPVLRQMAPLLDIDVLLFEPPQAVR